MYVPGAALEGWPELERIIAKQARLKKQQRELGTQLNALEHEEHQLQEMFVREAQDAYDRMSSGDLEAGVAEKRVSEKADKLKTRIAEIATESGDVNRRLEALRRNLEASEGEVEMVLKMGAPEQMARLSELMLETGQELEQALFDAQEKARAARDQYQGLQFIDQYLGRDEHTNPRQIGHNGSFGSGPETALMQAVQRTQELSSEVGRVRELLASGDQGETEQLPPGYVRTAAGTIGIVTDAD